MRLTASDIACERGGRLVFDGLSFACAAGEMVEVTGANGAGKSTLLRLIAGLLPLASGALVLDPADEEAPLPERVHYCGHKDAMKGALSVEENLAFWTTYLGGDLSRLPAAIARFDLASLADLPASYLSAGQRRRLSLARLLAAPRPVWLLDEPTAALDAANQDRLREVMAEHLAGGGIILAATHHPLGLPARTLRIGA